MTLFADPVVEQPDFERDRWGHPLIIPPTGGAPIPYVRASSNEIEDRYNLELWARRNVVWGMAHDDSLVARVLAIGGEPQLWDLATRQQVNRIHEDAATIAKSTRRANIGTAVHRLTERADRGESVIAGPYAADLDAYVHAITIAGYAVDGRFIECRLVSDDLQRAGTADRLLLNKVTGRHRVADIKTGETVEYGGLGWAAQLAAYAHADLYDVATGERTPLPSVDRTTGLIIHLPAGEGVCRLYEIDLVAGYRAAVLDNEVRAIRKESRRWISPVGRPVEMAGAETPPSAPADLVATRAAHPSVGRREALRQRYRALAADVQDRFRAMLVDPDDLDAVDVALGALEEGAATLPAVAAPTLPDPAGDDRCPHGEASHEQCMICEGEVSLADIHAVLGRDHDEGRVMADVEFDVLEARFKPLPDAMKFWVSALIAEAQRAGVPFHAHHARTERRYQLYTGLIRLAEAGVDDSDAVRALAALATGSDAPLFGAVSVGHGVGAMSAAEARTFADSAALLIDGALVAEFSGPAMRFVAL